ncbi:MAG: T9SS type A sorting domain-containing protein [Bacteroidales bacterium]|nr:T9SS type A sorting domain-containing protein [Bacteroidales bacterium]
MKNFYTFLLLFLISLTASYQTGAQTHFVVHGDPTSAMNIQLLETRFNGVDLIAGDEIGIFDGNFCVGAFLLTKSLGTYDDAILGASMAYKEENGGDGFVTGHSITYRFWDNSEQFEYSAVVSTCYTNQLVQVNCQTFDIGATCFVRLVADLVGIRDLTDHALQVDLYPNPTTGKVMIVLDMTLKSKAYLRIYNLTGQMILSTELPEKQTMIDLTGRAKGIYSVRITSDFPEIIRKIVLY